MVTRQHKRHLANLVSKRATYAWGLKIPVPDELSLAGAEQPDLHQFGGMIRSMQPNGEKTGKPSDHDEAMGKTLAVIATNAWRTKMKMLDGNTGQPKEEMRRAYRHIDSILDALQQLGIEIIDPVGRLYDIGMALKVVAFEPTAGISGREIKETIKPSVTWRGNFLQMGEVIVGTPENMTPEFRKDNHEANDD